MNSTTLDNLIPLEVQEVVEDKQTDTQIVVLRHRDGAEILPIWVGNAEGTAIRLSLDGIAPPRPMSHDLMRNFAEHFNVKVERVVVTSVKQNTYYSQIHLSNRGTDQVLDARPSDAIALAMRTHSPMFVTREVLAERGATSWESWQQRLPPQTSDDAKQEQG